MSLRDHLEAVRAKHGTLTPALVVKEARPKSAPLHNHFEWDDAAAGERYRLIQAHELIQSVRVTYTDKKGAPQSIRAFHAVREQSGKVAYRPVEEITDDPVMTEMLRRDMEREWRQLKARYDRFQEFKELVLSDLSATG